MAIKKEIEFKSVSSGEYMRILHKARSIAVNLPKTPDPKRKGGKREWTGFQNQSTGNRAVIVWDNFTVGRCQGIWIKQQTRAGIYPERFYPSRGHGYGTLRSMTE